MNKPITPKQKLQYTIKLNLAAPIEADEVHLRKVVLDFERGTLEIMTNMVDSNNGDPRIQGPCDVHMGLFGVPEEFLDYIEDKALDIAASSGRLPEGAKKKER